mgnify:CR=1 FL=1
METLNRCELLSGKCTISWVKTPKEAKVSGMLVLTIEKLTVPFVLLFVQVLYAKTEESEHKATEKHQESLHWRMATCEICSVKYNSSTSLESHMEQSKHAKQLSKIKKMGMDAETLVCYVVLLFMLNRGKVCINHGL